MQEWIDLNSSRSEKETIHLELAFDGAAPAYKPGDSLEVFPENDPAYVEQLLKSAGLASDDALRTEFLKQRDVTTLSLKTVENYAASTNHQYVKQLLESGEAKRWIEGRQFIDLIQGFPITLSAEQLKSFTRPLAPRAYSIASSRKEVGDEAHLLISTVRYESHGRERLGVASGFVGERMKKGDRIRVKVKPNKHFALPSSPDTNIIMVGPGTGVAPFRSFVQERRGAGAKGKNWLFFGDRSFTHDFLYQLEWQDALKDGSLARNGHRLLARYAGKGLRAEQAVGSPPRRRRLAGERRALLCVRRREGDGEGRALDAHPRLCRREERLPGSRANTRCKSWNEKTAICRTSIKAR